MFLLGLSFLFVIMNKISGEEICDKKKITVLWPNDTKQCLPCVECRRGWGSTYSCGEVLKAPLQTPIKCVRCKKRQTFSPGPSSDACKKCTPCQPNHQRIKKCTRSADTKCGGCKTGYYKFRDPLFSSCEKCSHCCGDTTDEWIEECARQGLPKNLQCSFRHDRNCSLSFNPQTTSQRVPLTKISRTVQKTMTSSVTMQPAAVESSVSGPTANEWHAVGIGLPVSLILIAVLIVGGMWHQRQRRYTSVRRNSTSDESSNREQERHEPGEDDEQNVIVKDAAPSRPLKEFTVDRDERSKYDEFCRLINTKKHPLMVKHYHIISKAFDITDWDIINKLMEQECGAAQALFEYLDASKSEPGTLEQMACVLDSLSGRDPAAKMLRDADHRLKQKAFALQQEA